MIDGWIDGYVIITKIIRALYFFLESITGESRMESILDIIEYVWSVVSREDDT